jgi:hypothetical protein
MGALPRWELWKIKIDEGNWEGTADLAVGRNSHIRGDMSFPRDPNGVENEVTGLIEGDTVTLYRKLTGTNAGKVQVWKGKYYSNGTAASGTATNGGGPYHWSATIKVP